MNRNKFNKKLVNNLILGSFLLGASAGMISIVQATSMPPNQEQDVHQYDKKATEQLRALRSKLAPVEEWIKLVDREKGADPNGEVKGLVPLRCLVPLEEAILRSNSKAVEILIKKGADVNRMIGSRRKKNGREYGHTLLHLAVYSPKKMRKLLNEHITAMSPYGGGMMLEKQMGAKQRGIKPNGYLPVIGEKDMFPILHVSAEIVDLLLKHMPKEKICISEDESPDKTPSHLAFVNRNKLANGIKEGEYDAKEYAPILKEYDKIVDLLEKHAPSQRPLLNVRVPQHL
jgi:hypothetical protein